MESKVEMINNLISTLEMVEKYDNKWNPNRILTLIDWITYTSIMLESANLIKESEELKDIGNIDELIQLVKNEY